MKKFIASTLILSICLMSCSHLLPIKEDESITAYYERINSNCEGKMLPYFCSTGMNIKVPGSRSRMNM